MSIEYRPFSEKDAEEVSCLIKKTLTIINSMDYPQSVISGLLEYYTSSKLLEISKKCQFIIAIKEGKIVGVGGLESNLIRSLFIEPEFQHKKIGSNILAELECIARSHQVDVIHVRSSITGMYFYASRGYKIEKEEMTLRAGLNFYMKKEPCNMIRISLTIYPLKDILKVLMKARQQSKLIKQPIRFLMLSHFFGVHMTPNFFNVWSLS